MSESLALVRFADGQLRVAYYFGSTDLVVPPLFLIEEADAVWAGGMESVLERLTDEEELSAVVEDAEEVDIWTSYGSGAYWRGRASRERAMIVDGVDPYGNGAEMGGPMDEPRDVHHGTPDCVPFEFRD